MAMVINSNIQSLNAQRNLSISQNDMKTAMERLTSGKRINSAKDDAAGLAISNKLTSQVRGLDQAIRNANDGMSLIQTAEGALEESTNILQRMRELSIQSANGTFSSGNRTTLNAEVTQLKAELDRISSTTSFNGQNILDGSMRTLSLQVGAQSNQTITTGIKELSTSTLGVAQTAGISSQGVTADISNIQGLGTGDLIINGVAIGSAVTSADTASVAAKAGSAISIAAAINEKSAQTGVVATVGETRLGGAAMTGADTAGLIRLNGVEIALTTSEDTAATRTAIVNAINARSLETGVIATDTGNDNGGITLVAQDGRNIAILLDDDSGDLTAASTGLNAVEGDISDPDEIGQVTTGSVSLSSIDGKDIKEELN